MVHCSGSATVPADGGAGRCFLLRHGVHVQNSKGLPRCSCQVTQTSNLGGVYFLKIGYFCPTTFSKLYFSLKYSENCLPPIFFIFFKTNHIFSLANQYFIFLPLPGGYTRKVTAGYPISLPDIRYPAEILAGYPVSLTDATLKTRDVPDIRPFLYPVSDWLTG